MIVRWVPVCSVGSPSASRGPFICIRLKSIGQLMRSVILSPFFSFSAVAGPCAWAVCQMWQPLTVWTIASCTVFDGAATANTAATRARSFMAVP